MKNSARVRKMTVTAVLAAVSTVLMYLEFPIPIMPGFIKFDFSDLPALIASFTFGPLSGIAVCFLKNLVHLFATATGGVGELANFILSACFILPAGIIFKYKKTRSWAFIGALLGSLLMAVVSLFSNYYVVYPIYTAFMPMEAIIDAYKLINPSIENLWQALLIFNMPFTFIKGLLSTVITVLIYNKLAPVLRGKTN